MAFVEEPNQAKTSRSQNDQGKASAFSSKVALSYEEQSEGENENERLLLFSDGIIAFTITLATISIRLPTNVHSIDFSAILTDLGPYLLTYLIGFVIVGSYWYEHWRFFRYIKHSSTALVVWNLLFLASLVFLPFLSHYYGGNFYLSGDREKVYLVITTLFFYTFFLITGILLLVVWIYAVRRHRLFDEKLSRAVVRNTTLRLLHTPSAIIIYLVAFLAVGDSITTSVLPVIVFLVFWEVLRYLLLRGTPTLKPLDTRRLVISVIA